MDESERSLLLAVAVIVTITFPVNVALLFLPQMKANRIARKMMMLFLLPQPALVIGLVTVVYPSTFRYGLAFLAIWIVLVFIKRGLIRQTLQQARDETAGGPG